VSYIAARAPLTSSTDDHRHAQSFRPWWRWLLTALAFPPAGLIAHVVAGRVDTVPAAVLNGVITGAGIGAVQWALLRHRHVSPMWIVATAAGLGAGLASGAAIVSYRTDITSLALMGAASGFAVGLAQGALLATAQRTLGWAAVNTGLFALGWTVTTAGGIDVSQQWAVFGAYGCTALAFLQSMIIDAFVPSQKVTP
jgi:hypothetical protein